MNPLKNPYWEYFAHLAAAFAENGAAMEVISQAAALTGEKARESLLSMDYTATLNLSPTVREDSKTLVLEQGYHFFVTGIQAMQLQGNHVIPVRLQFRDDANENDFSGGPLVYGMTGGDRGLIDIDAGFASYDQSILQEPREFFRYVGNRGILQVRAKLDVAPAGNDTKKINVIIKGFKICLSEV